MAFMSIQVRFTLYFENYKNKIPHTVAGAGSIRLMGIVHLMYCFQITVMMLFTAAV